MIGYEKVDPKVFERKVSQRPGRCQLQKFLTQFHESDDKVIRLTNWRDNYVGGIASCLSSFVVAIRRSGYPMKAIQVDKEVYLVKLTPDGEWTF